MPRNEGQSTLFFGPWYRKSPFFEATQRAGAKGLAVNSGMDVDISEPDVSPLQVQGPDSKNVLKDLVGPKVLDLGYYYFMSEKIDGIPVVITRTGWTAEVGYEIYLTDGRRGV